MIKIWYDLIGDNRFRILYDPVGSYIRILEIFIDDSEPYIIRGTRAQDLRDLVHDLVL